MDFDEADADALGEVIAADVEREVDYRPIEIDGARKAAELIAEMM